jgi:hypothetical protein
MYGAIKSENEATQNVALALVGVGATYVVATLAFAEKFGKEVPWPIVAALPTALWVIAAYHSILTITTMLNALSIQVLEAKLKDWSGLDTAVQNAIGQSSNEKLVNITVARWPHKLAIVVTFAGVALLIVGYTAYALYVAWSHISPLSWGFFLVLYAALLVVTAASWTYGFAKEAQERAAAGL